MTRRGLPLRGKVLRDLRLAREWKQDRLAEALGVSLKTVGNWENAGREIGGRAEPEHIAELAEKFGVPQEALIAPGYAPPEPITTAEARLAAIQQQLLSLTGAVADVALGVQALVSHAGATPRSSGAAPKRTRRSAPGDSQAG